MGEEVLPTLDVLVNIHVPELCSAVGFRRETGEARATASQHTRITVAPSSLFFDQLLHTRPSGESECPRYFFLHVQNREVFVVQIHKTVRLLLLIGLLDNPMMSLQYFSVTNFDLIYLMFR